MKSCQEIMQLASRQLDEPLTVGQRLSLYLHLRMCEGCRDAAKMLRTIHDRAGFSSQTDAQLAAGETLSEESRSRIAIRLQQEAE